MTPDDTDQLAQTMATVKQHANRIIDLASQMEKLNAQQNEHITRAQIQLTDEGRVQLSRGIMLVYTLGDKLLGEMSKSVQKLSEIV